MRAFLKVAWIVFECKLYRTKSGAIKNENCGDIQRTSYRRPIDRTASLSSVAHPSGGGSAPLAKFVPT